MSSNSENPTGVTEQAWLEYKTAFETVLSEMATAGESVAGVAGTEELRQMISEAISAVLIESHFLEKFVSKQIKTHLSQAGNDLSTLLPTDTIKEACKEVMREYSLQQVGSVLRQEIKQIVQSKLLEFGNSEEFKDILDSRFRTMEQYMRSEVIPRTMKKIAEEQV